MNNTNNNQITEQQIVALLREKVAATGIKSLILRIQSDSEFTGTDYPVCASVAIPGDKFGREYAVGNSFDEAIAEIRKKVKEPSAVIECLENKIAEHRKQIDEIKARAMAEGSAA